MRVLLVGLWNREEGDSKKTFWQRGHRSSMIHHVLYLFGQKKKKKGKESNREAKNRYDRNMLLHALQVFQANVLSLKSQCYTELNIYLHWRLPLWPSGKETACDAGDVGSTPGSGGSTGEGSGNTFQYSCLGNPMNRGAWRAIVHSIITESDMTSD